MKKLLDEIRHYRISGVQGYARCNCGFEGPDFLLAAHIRRVTRA